MSDIYTTIVPILTGIAAIAMTVAGYLLYRQKEIIALAKEVLDLIVVAKASYEDKNISEEEYGKIIQELNDVSAKLKNVVYKV